MLSGRISSFSAGVLNLFMERGISVAFCLHAGNMKFNAEHEILYMCLFANFYINHAQ